MGEVDRAVAEQVVLAYDTEKRLQAQGLASQFEIQDWTIEAGPAYVEGAIAAVGEGVKSASEQAGARPRAPFRRQP